MRKEFPYPLKTQPITIYGRKDCIYCRKLKSFITEFYNDKRYAVYYDIQNIIDKKYAKDINDFRKKMEIFIGDYKMVPLVFIHGIFIGGYSKFCELMFSLASNDYKNTLANMLLVNNDIKIIKQQKELMNKLKKKNKCT